MSRRTGRAAAEVIGAIIGAGFASGREIDAFFTRSGPWGWAGMAAAAAVIGAVCASVLARPGVAGMPEAWQGRPMAAVWRGLFAGLMAVTGGAMLAGAGEAAALLLPFHGARGIGMAATLLAALALAKGEGAGMAWVSRTLIVCLTVVLAPGLAQKPMAGTPVRAACAPWTALARGVCYGGFNVALAVPVLSEQGRMTAPERRRCALLVAALFLTLLAVGNGVLCRHPALQGEALPFVRLLSGWGKPGYWLGGAALYLADLTTLTAALRGIRDLSGGSAWLRRALIGLLIGLSLLGFGEVVAWVYPALGGACAALLALAVAQGRRA